MARATKTPVRGRTRTFENEVLYCIDCQDDMIFDLQKSAKYQRLAIWAIFIAEVVLFVSFLLLLYGNPTLQ